LGALIKRVALSRDTQDTSPEMRDWQCTGDTFTLLPYTFFIEWYDSNIPGTHLCNSLKIYCECYYAQMTWTRTGGLASLASHNVRMCVQRKLFEGEVEFFRIRPNSPEQMGTLTAEAKHWRESRDIAWCFNTFFFRDLKRCVWLYAIALFFVIDRCVSGVIMYDS
jgi:hypothetical protein